MSSFISRFNSKKSQQPAQADISRNQQSQSPCKQNTAPPQIQQNPTATNINNQNAQNSRQQPANTSNDIQNKQTQQQREEILISQLEQLMEQMKDLETSLQINKGIIKSLLDPILMKCPTQTLQQVILSLRKENANLEQQVARVRQQRNYAQSKLLSGEDESALNQMKEYILSLEKSIADLKVQLKDKDVVLQTKDQAYNELLQLSVQSSKNDKNLLSKIRELKFKHTESGSFNYGVINMSQLPTSITAADDSNEGTPAVNISQENQQLKRDLDFATQEIERLRKKLVVEESDIPPLVDEFFGIGLSKENSKSILSTEQTPNSKANNDFMGMKEALASLSNAKNSIYRARAISSSSSFCVGRSGVPKLDFKQLSKVQEFKDWYTYASKLEESVLFLRQRVKELEEDEEQLNAKYRKEVAKNEQLFLMNEKLNKALKRANLKIMEIKDKYKEKCKKKCHFCDKQFETSMTLNTDIDQIQITEITGGHSFMGQQSFSSGEKYVESEENENKGNEYIKIQDNIMKNEFDQLRKQQLQQSMMRVSKSIAKLNQIAQQEEEDPKETTVICKSQQVNQGISSKLQDACHQAPQQRASEKILSGLLA